MKGKIFNFVRIFLCLLLALSFCFQGMNVETSTAKADEIFDSILVKYKSSSNLVSIKIPQGTNFENFLATYQNLPEVEYAEPNVVFHASIVPGDPSYNKEWYLEKIRAPLAWDRIRETPNIVIAVIDSGVQITHPDLAVNIWINAREIPGNGIDDDGNGFIDDYTGWDFVNNVPDPQPKFQDGFSEAGIMHGTIVAGIIAATGNNGKGVVGVTWQAKIMALKALDDKGEGMASDVIRAIDYAIQAKAAIINLSFVTPNYSRGLYEAIKRAYDAGIIVVAAAGNEQSDGQGYNLNDTPLYPACDNGDSNMVIGVAATDGIDQKASFSGYGSRCVDISAPGIGFYTTAVYAPLEDVAGVPFDQYYSGYWSGTSLSAPVVAGVAALIEGINPGAKAKEVQDILLASADDISRLNPTFLGELGTGRVNAYRAIALAETLMLNKSVKLLFSSATKGQAEVKVTDQDGKLIKKFNAFSSGGVNLASGDVDADKKYEIIAGAGSGGQPMVKIFDAAGILKKQFLAYDKKFTGGVKVAVGDFDNDGIGEIVTAPGAGMKSDIKIFDFQGRLRNQFLAYDQKFVGGVNIAIGDVDGDGSKEIVTGQGAGGGPQVKIFNAAGKTESQFIAFDKNFRGGVNVAVGDINGGAVNRKEEIVTAPVKSGGPHVRIFDETGKLQGQFFAYAQTFRGGVSLAVGDTDGDSLAEIITGAGPGGSPHIRVFEPNGTIISSFYGFAPEFNGGVNVGTLSVNR